MCPVRSTSLVRLTDTGVGYSDLWPRFSADGKRIVFASRRDNDFEIYTMKPDGSEQARLTRSKGIDARPVYSPDGSLPQRPGVGSPQRSS